MTIRTYPRRWPSITREYCRYFEQFAPQEVKSIRKYARQATTFMEWYREQRGVAATTTGLALWRQFKQADVERFLHERLDVIKQHSVYHLWKAIRHFSRWLHHMRKRHDDPAREVTWASLTGLNRAGNPGGGRKVPPSKKAPIIRVSRKRDDLLKLSNSTLAHVFASDARMNQVSSSHANNLEWYANAFLKWLPVSLTDIGRDDVIGFVDWYAATPTARTGNLPNPNTVRKAWQAVSKFCGWLEVCKILDENPCKDLKGPRGRRSRIQPLPDDVFENLIAASGEGSTLWLRKRDAFIITFLCHTGCRVSEMLSLTRADVEGRDVVTVIAKGHRAEETRWIGLHPRVKEAAREYLAMRFDRSPALVINQDGTPMAVPGVRMLCKRIGEKIGCHFSPHDLRRTYFTKLARSGAPWYTIKAAGGWSTTAAAEHYLHGAANDLGAAAQMKFDPLAAPA